MNNRIYLSFINTFFTKQKRCNASKKLTHGCFTLIFIHLHHPTNRDRALHNQDFFSYICAMIRILTLLFSVYFLSLSCIPCSDKDDCKYPKSDQSTLATTDHNSHNNNTENCSPFCMCACCGQSCNFEHLQTDLGFNFPTVLQKTTVYKSSFVSDVSFSIWQPPKI